MNNCIKAARDLQKFSKNELYEAALLMGLEMGGYTKKEIILFIVVHNESVKAINGYEKYMRNLRK